MSTESPDITSVISRLTELHSRATSGQWFVETSEEDDGPPIFYVCHPGTECDVTTVPSSEDDAAFIVAIKNEWPQIASTLSSLNGEVERLRRQAELSEQAHLETIDQRDSAEEAVSRLVESVTGDGPEWSNLYGYREAIADVQEELARRDDRSTAAEARVKELKAENERLRAALEDVVAPLRKLQRDAEAEGSKLSYMAHGIANDLGFVQSIAHEALSSVAQPEPCPSEVASPSRQSDADLLEALREARDIALRPIVEAQGIPSGGEQVGNLACVEQALARVNAAIARHEQKARAALSHQDKTEGGAA